MWWQDRGLQMKRHKLQILIFLQLTACNLLLTSCGFSPVYGTHSHNNASQAAPTSKAGLNNVEILNIPNREGQLLRNALIDRFYTSGTPTNAKYTLKISPIQENIYNFDITIDSEATRRQLRLKTRMELIDNETNKTLVTQHLLSIASYNVLTSEFSTLVTEQSARKNALNDLARQIERQVALYFNK